MYKIGTGLLTPLYHLIMGNGGKGGEGGVDEEVPAKHGHNSNKPITVAHITD